MKYCQGYGTNPRLSSNHSVFLKNLSKENYQLRLKKNQSHECYMIAKGISFRHPSMRIALRLSHVRCMLS